MLVARAPVVGARVVVAMAGALAVVALVMLSILTNSTSRSMSSTGTTYE